MTSRSLGFRPQSTACMAVAILGAWAAGCDAPGSLPEEPAPDLMQQDHYPEGPFGGEVGQVPLDFHLEGYFSPTRTEGLAAEERFGPVTFDQLRTSGARYAMIHLAALW